MPQIWLKRVLVPFWVIQLIFLIVLFILGCAALSLASKVDWEDVDSEYDYSELKRVIDIGAGLLLGFSGICILFDIIEIFQFARRTLSPVLHLVFACIKTAIWTFYLVATLVGGVNHTALGIIFAIVLFGTSLGQLIYGSVIMHRHRKGTLYLSANREELGMVSPIPGASHPAYDVQATSFDVRPNPFRDPSPAAPGVQKLGTYAPRGSETAYEPYRGQ